MTPGKTGRWTAVFLAAGLGRRFGGPKQLEPLGPAGELLCDYGIYDARRSGAERAVLVIRSEHEAQWRRHHAGGKSAFPIQHVVQRVNQGGRQRPWGTVPAVLAARSVISGPFAVANGDDFYSRAAWRAVGNFLQSVDPERAACAVVGYRLRTTLSPHGGVSRAVLEVGAGGTLAGLAEVTEIEEREGSLSGLAPCGLIPLNPDQPVSMNLWAMSPALLPLLARAFSAFLARSGQSAESECLLPDVMADLIRSAAVRGQVLPTASGWFGLTHPADRKAVTARLRELVAAGEYPSPVLDAR